MSETMEAKELTPIPGYATRAFTATRAGQSYDALEVTFGLNPVRKVTVRNPDMADQFDLVEIGGASADNSTWMNMAVVAVAVEDIDGVPQPPISRREHIRGVIKRLGADGMAAAARGINSMQAAPEVEIADAAKN